MIPTSDFTPASMSLNRTSIGWLKLSDAPGSSPCTTRSICGTSSDLSWARFQAALSLFRRMNTSVLFIPPGSMPISGRPVRLTTDRTSSGNSASRTFSILVESLRYSARDESVGLRKIIWMSPSSSLGMNSPPSCMASGIVPSIKTEAASATVTGLRTAQASTGA